jgi:VanZ family protein
MFEMKAGEVRRFLRQALRPGFWIALLFVLVLALSPRPVDVPLVNDKLLHAISFFVLAGLGIAAWGRKSWIIVALGLAGVGGAIELLQATPFISRDAEFLDWVADLTGIALALLMPASIVLAKDWRYTRRRRS